jgi:nitrilase
MPKIAVVQRAPRVLDRAGTLELAARTIDEAAESGAGLVVFPEAFIPGYPAWIWRLRPGADLALAEELHARLLRNSVDIGRGDLKPLSEAAARRGVTIVCGMNERDGAAGGGTLYNTVVVIGPDGSLLNRHRKLMPTNPERMVWGTGDATGLRVVPTPCGRLGTLICWESYMPLARFALYGEGVEVYIAPTYDCGDGWVGTLQHIAREGRCWVVGAGVALKATDLPEDFPEKARLYPDPGEWVNKGDSVVIRPGGKVVAGPLRAEQGILYADLEPGEAGAARRTLDVAGHYARPDVFQLRVDRRPLKAVEFVAPRE